MVCIKCGIELKEGTKFCVKCGARCKKSGLISKFKIFSYLSFLSIIGMIGLIVFRQMWHNNREWNILVFVYVSNMLIHTGIVFSIIALFRQKCKLALIAGLIPCAYLALGYLFRLFPFLPIELLRIFVL